MAAQQNRKTLSLAKPSAPVIRPPRGPLLDPTAVVAMFFTLPDGRVLRDARWCREHLPHKVRLGHRTVAWYRDDVADYLEHQREDAA